MDALRILASKPATKSARFLIRNRVIRGYLTKMVGTLAYDMMVKNPDHRPIRQQNKIGNANDIYREHKNLRDVLTTPMPDHIWEEKFKDE